MMKVILSPSKDFDWIWKSISLIGLVMSISTSNSYLFAFSLPAYAQRFVGKPENRSLYVSWSVCLSTMRWQDEWDQHLDYDDGASTIGDKKIVFFRKANWQGIDFIESISNESETYGQMSKFAYRTLIDIKHFSFLRASR